MKGFQILWHGHDRHVVPLVSRRPHVARTDCWCQPKLNPRIECVLQHREDKPEE